jgi:sigma-B regulation protein RsbU (phosphoserine phosphatase)
MAVGLDSGMIFDSSLEEKSIDLLPGDLFVFYTDGISEGMNKSLEEFGEARLQKVIQDSNNLSAGETLNLIFRKYKQFVGRHEQHDDLTCVVLKVLA